MENSYTVYMHILPNNKIYIGMTCKKPIYRWNNGNGYFSNKELTKSIKEYGWENVKHEILYENLTKEEAEQKEIELIARYKANNRKYGYNIENGGMHKGKTSYITRKKQSRARLGKKVLETTKKKISNTLKGTRHGTPLLKMKPIDVYDMNNNFVKHYDCMTDCQNETGIRKQYISLCCQGKKESSNGYKFKYSAK